jgi:hypothetical protein
MMNWKIVIVLNAHDHFLNFQVEDKFPQLESGYHFVKLNIIISCLVWHKVFNS